MDLKQLVIAPLIRPQVVHSLPGRVRLHLAALQHLPGGDPRLVELIEDILAVPNEINSVRANSNSGTLLISYDCSAVEEGDVVRFVHGIARVFARDGQSLARLSADELTARKDSCFSTHIRSARPRTLLRAIRSAR